MGKGNRNSQKRAQNMAENPEMYLENKKTQGKKNATDKAVAIICIVVAVMIAAILIVSVLDNTGVIDRLTPAVSMEDVTVDRGMMKYLMYQTISEFINNYSVYIQYGWIKIDFSKDLSTQACATNDVKFDIDIDGDGLISWYDYFIYTPVNTMIYAQAAKSANLQLTDAEKAEIKAAVNEEVESYKASGMDLSSTYGTGVTASTLQRCKEMEKLAEKYASKRVDDEKDALKADDTALRTYVKDNKELYYSATCLKYTKTIDRSKFISDEAYATAKDKADKFAADIVKAESYNEFISKIENYINPPKNTETNAAKAAEAETEAKTEAATGEESTKEETTKLPSGVVETEIGYSEETNELDSWLFGENESDWAQEGDIHYITETKNVEDTTEKETTANKENSTEKETSTDKESSTEKETTAASGSKAGESDGNEPEKKTHEVYTLTVYYVLKPCDLDHEYSSSFAFLLVDDKAYAEKFQQAFANAATKSLQSFYDLADSMHETNHTHHDDEVMIYEKVEEGVKGYFNTNYDLMNQWIEAEGRKSGELSGVIEIKIASSSTDKDAKPTYNYAVIFYDKLNNNEKGEAWYVNAFTDTLNYNVKTWFRNEVKSGKIAFEKETITDIINEILGY